MYILQDGDFTTKRSVDLGLRDLEQTISDVRGVDIHMAHAHILSDYNDVLSEDVSAELFNRMAIEIMKAVNFYNYNNRERSLLENLSLRRRCGGRSDPRGHLPYDGSDVHNAEGAASSARRIGSGVALHQSDRLRAAKVRRRWNEA